MSGVLDARFHRIAERLIELEGNVKTWLEWKRDEYPHLEKMTDSVDAGKALELYETCQKLVKEWNDDKFGFAYVRGMAKFAYAWCKKAQDAGVYKMPDKMHL